ncbi:hypothetical protein SAMN05444722_1965 [Rhodovulum sp. ES.010]|uniref:hypothetical protein n=1 Tax=Rhodovulum sp. ES.010 TaxID=1882821 RepID=UPI000927D970|nr:hypothetical protein [Rhodovulum sp. ES.010]SIO41061.1 hypothetical protein SAMN05444722_1965 [Rhodovulum sp. ES.010]
MPRRLALSLAAIILTAPALAPAQTARQCGPRGAVLDILAERYGESRQAAGLAANNAVVELFANLQTGTWTITGTTPAGVTCLIASGEAYEALAESLIPGEGA